jgi:PIN domain nuclease of toxin-antitoxin system
MHGQELCAELATRIVLVSAASAWEIATKVRLGKLPGAVDVAADLTAVMVDQGFESLAITVAHRLRAGNLPGPHRDPFDCMLIAPALPEDLPLITNETVFDVYGIRRIW